MGCSFAEEGRRKCQKNKNLRHHSFHLVDGVDGLHDPVLEELEVAELDRIVDAVILQVLIFRRLQEVPCACHGVPVHVTDSTVARNGVECGGPGNKNEKCNIKPWAPCYRSLFLEAEIWLTKYLSIKSS